jgi:alkanesulfonate monooxygenase SsuD/methylene tetrahydromethanopterin reductase-like flavin-dependent oxidoreductase (luciferase family)
VKLGAHFLPEELPTYLASVRRADEAGYARAWLVDGQMLWQDIYVYLTRGLLETERLAFGPAVTNPLTRHITVTASAAATLADHFPGRVLLGLGRGDNAVRTLGRGPVPTTALADAVPRIRALMAGEEVEVDGREMRIRWAGPEAGPPILMAATGPKNLRLAGALADIAMIYVGTHPASVAWAIDHVRRGAREAGRDPDEVEISMLCGMWVSDDQQEAWDESRWAPAACANHIAYTLRWNPDEELPDEMTRLARAREDYDYYAGHLDSKADHAAYLTTELIDDFVIAGPPERCLERIHALARLGVGEVSSAYLNGRLGQLDRVGREIIPELAGLATS